MRKIADTTDLFCQIFANDHTIKKLAQFRLNFPAHIIFCAVVALFHICNLHDILFSKKVKGVYRKSNVDLEHFPQWWNDS